MTNYVCMYDVYKFKTNLFIFKDWRNNKNVYNYVYTKCIYIFIFIIDIHKRILNYCKENLRSDTSSGHFVFIYYSKYIVAIDARKRALK